MSSAPAVGIKILKYYAACGGDESSVNGTYDVYTCNTDTMVCTTIGQQYVLKDGKVNGMAPGVGYKVEDGNIVFTMGEQKATYKKKDNYYYMSTGNGHSFAAFCKHGETPKGFTVYDERT